MKSGIVRSSHSTTDVYGTSNTASALGIEMIRLKEEYILARCCSPAGTDSIMGYYSHDNFIKVHKSDCPNLNKADASRLVALNWSDIIAPEDFTPAEDYKTLDATDFAILRHHRVLGVDYSLKVAAILHIDEQKIFDSHRKLRDMALLERVKPLMMQYRKNIVKNKWIKHRNHTYYELTEKGKNYLDYYLKSR